MSLSAHVIELQPYDSRIACQGYIDHTKPLRSPETNWEGGRGLVTLCKSVPVMWAQRQEAMGQNYQYGFQLLVSPSYSMSDTFTAL